MFQVDSVENPKALTFFLCCCNSERMRKQTNMRLVLGTQEVQGFLIKSPADLKEESVT